VLRLLEAGEAKKLKYTDVIKLQSNNSIKKCFLKHSFLIESYDWKFE